MSQDQKNKILKRGNESLINDLDFDNPNDLLRLAIFHRVHLAPDEIYYTIFPKRATKIDRDLICDDGLITSDFTLFCESQNLN